MYVRCAYFQGDVDPADRERFDRFMDEEIMPRLVHMPKVRAIRLDSGDFLELSRRSRKMLDDAGLGEVQIIASSGLDEYEIAALVAKDAPIDGFGVGSKLAVVEDAPYLVLLSRSVRRL